MLMGKNDYVRFQSEVLAYLQEVAEFFGVLPNVAFGKEVQKIILGKLNQRIIHFSQN